MTKNTSIFKTCPHFKYIDWSPRNCSPFKTATDTQVTRYNHLNIINYHCSRKRQIENVMMQSIWKVDINKVEFGKSKVGVGSKVSLNELKKIICLCLESSVIVFVRFRWQCSQYVFFFIIVINSLIYKSNNNSTI